MCKVSIIMPVYNVSPYLSKAIDSVIVQDFEGWELIIVDDGSTDDSGLICDLYTKKDTRIRTIHQENSGLSSARNTGVKMAKGNYLTFIDSDDFIHPTYVSALYGMISSRHIDIAVCDFEAFYENAMPIEKAHPYKIDYLSSEEALLKIVKDSNRRMIVAWGKLYAKDLFNELCFPEGKYHEDEFLTYKLFDRAKGIAVTSAALYFYLQRETSIMGEQYNLKRLDKLDALEEAVAYFKDKNRETLMAFAIYRYLLNIQISYYRVRYETKAGEKPLMELYDRYKKKYIEIQRNQSKKIGIMKRMHLYAFYRFPSLYIRLIYGIIKIYPNIKGA